MTPTSAFGLKLRACEEKYTTQAWLLDHFSRRPGTNPTVICPKFRVRKGRESPRQAAFTVQHSPVLQGRWDVARPILRKQEGFHVFRRTLRLWLSRPCLREMTSGVRFLLDATLCEWGRSEKNRNALFSGSGLRLWDTRDARCRRKPE